jgi:anti-anti-sigma factor
MHMLRNLKIGTKLLLGYLTVLVLMLMIGAVAWRSTTLLTTAFDDMAHNNLEGAVYLADAQNALWQLRYGFPQYLVLAPADRAKIVADENKWYQIVDKNMQAYARGGRTPEAQAALQEWQANYTKYVQARPRWFQLISEGKTEEAAAWRAQTTTPYGKATVETFERLIALERDAATHKRAEAALVAETTSGILLGVLGGALVLGLGLAVVLTRSIARPLGAMTNAARAVTSGELDVLAPVTSHDELGILATAFNQMTVNLRQRIAAEQTAQAERLHLQQEIIRVQEATLRELSTPLIPLTPRVLLLPLIGSIDSSRAAQMLETLLVGVAQHRAHKVLLDLSGVRVVDAQVAQALVQTAQAVRLLGAEVVLVGIRAEVAQAIIATGAMVETLPIYATLEMAITTLLPSAVQQSGGLN